MKELNQQLTNQVSGAFIFAPFLWGCVAGSIAYLAGHHKDRDGTIQGFAAQTIGTGVSTSFAGLGLAGRAISVINVANTVEAVGYIDSTQES